MAHYCLSKLSVVFPSKVSSEIARLLDFTPISHLPSVGDFSEDNKYSSRTSAIFNLHIELNVTVHVFFSYLFDYQHFYEIMLHLHALY